MKRALHWMVLVALIAGGLALANDAVVAQSGTTVTVLCSQYLRSQPAEESPRTGLMNPGESHAVLGRYGGWVYVQVSGDLQGWAYYGDCLVVNGDFDALPILDPAQLQLAVLTAPPTATVACAQYLRRAPDSNAEVIKILDGADSPLSISSRTPDNSWVQVTTVGGQVGWAGYTECLRVQGDFYAVPAMSYEAAMPAAPAAPVVSAAPSVVTNVTVNAAPTARILCTQYMRATPSAEGARLAIMAPGDGVYDVTGRNEDSSWLYLSLPGGYQGWAGWGDCLDVTGNVFSLPALDQASYSGPPLATVVCTQYLRTAPNINARTLDPMAAGTTLTVEGRSADGSWVYVSKDDGSRGWTALGVCLNVVGNVYARPVFTPDGYDGSPVATVSCSQYLRQYPDGSSERLWKIDGAEGPLNITGRSSNNSWMQITLANGTVGWAATGVCLGVLGDFYSVPVVQDGPSPYGGPPQAAVNCSQFLRAEPNRDAEPVLVINGVEGDLSITGRSADGAWMRIALADGTTGWAATNACLSVLGTFTDAPVINTAAVAPPGVPTAVTLTCDQNLRAAPEADAERIDVLRLGDTSITLLGRNADTSWLYVRRGSDGSEGWTSGPCLQFQGDANGLPVRGVNTYDGPPVADVVCDANLRRTPTGDGTVLAVLTAETGLFNALARTTDGYLLVEGGSGLAGWLSQGACVATQGNVLALPVPGAVSDQSLWTVLRAEGACSGADQASQVIAAYNRGAPIGPVSRQCSNDSAGLLAVAQFRAEIAIVGGECPGFQSVRLSGGQSLCYRTVRTTQVDDFINYARGQ